MPSPSKIAVQQARIAAVKDIYIKAVEADRCGQMLAEFMMNKA